MALSTKPALSGFLARQSKKSDTESVIKPSVIQDNGSVVSNGAPVIVPSSSHSMP